MYPDLGEYFARREQLVSEDRKQRLDARTSNKVVDEVEGKADRLVRAIRAQEARNIWGPDSNVEVDNDTHLFPGMAFLTAREIITKTQLFKIMSRLPKGALLHAHLDATVNVEVLLRLALRHPAIHVRTPKVLTANSIGSIQPEFRALRRSEWDSASSVTALSYIPGEWVPLRVARQNFDPTLGGPEGFDKWLTSAITISPAEAYRTHNTTQKIWQKFQSTFHTAGPLILYLPVWKDYVREFFRSSIDDGISYLEVRINFLHRYIFNEAGEEIVTHSTLLGEYDRILNEVKEEMRQQGREDEFIGSKIIYSTIRFIPPDELQWYLDDCITLKQKFPHLIAGFDLVGHEDALRPLTDYLEPLTKFVERQKELGIEIPFIFHAGETLGDGTNADNNLYDAILLGTKRIGHGFSLIKHPKLMEICKEGGIAVEVCPISNEILRLTSSMPMHPLPALINHGVPVSLCSDDPAVFGNMGLSFDFFQVLVASEVSGLITMKELARRSFKYSSLDENEKQLAVLSWDKQWKKFLQWLEQEYPALEA
ncbi:Metallo-dependent hydrolase [Irpex rosettiformis]|uniref:Metallo-dependent hydrolase n=1 Tax=Irpex rosettiformis TaxID=378272 RepID=A0ACB8TVR2_9APHY|nr:Metallo-dependent hydrolase [Irpex rosettiformis]